MTRTTEYETFWRCKGLFDGLTSIEEMIAELTAAADDLRDMAAAGVTLREVVADDYAFLVTTDPAVAERWGMEPVGE